MTHMATNTNNKKKDKGTGRFITEPRSLDILCGKTKECMVHPGTRRFRVIIDSYKDTYAQTLTKFDKMAVTLTIYEILSNASSRFLKYNKAHSAWEELSVSAARDKVGHALRFANRVTNRQDNNLNCMITQPGQSNILPAIPSSQSILPSIPSCQSFGLNQALQMNHQELQQQQQHLQSSASSPAPAAPMVPQQPNDTAAAPAATPVSNTNSLQNQVQNLGSLIDMATTMKLATDTISLLNSISGTNDGTTVIA